MERTWTEKSIREWIERRNAYRKKKNLAPLSELNKIEHELALKAEAKCLKERSDGYSTSVISWEVQKHPRNMYPAPFSGTLYLPLNMNQKSGVNKIKFHKGDDLNYIVFKFYQERVDPSYHGTNFVGQDELLCERHEYLGPQPFVVGFQFIEANRNAFIEWWDAYLKIKWVGEKHWKNEIYFDKTIGGWAAKIRGDCSHNLDDEEYAGCD